MKPAAVATVRASSEKGTAGMIHSEQPAAKILSPEELDEVRDLWGCGVPLVTLAKRKGLALAELERQLAAHRRQRFGEPRDLKKVAADLQRQIEARQRGRRPGSQNG